MDSMPNSPKNSYESYNQSKNKVSWKETIYTIVSIGALFGCLALIDYGCSPDKKPIENNSFTNRLERILR